MQLEEEEEEEVEEIRKDCYSMLKGLFNEKKQKQKLCIKNYAHAGMSSRVANGNWYGF